MTLRNKQYTNRIIDAKIKEYLKIFGAISVEGPKWCGKTWTSLNHAESVVYLDDPDERQKANLDLDLILDRKSPELIDEWNLVPQVWDAVRRRCDNTTKKGNYLLTCSTRLTDDETKQKIHHSGAGRIDKVQMRTMSLYESGHSSGLASLTAMRFGQQKSTTIPDVKLTDLANAIVRGGWPSNQRTPLKKQGIIPKSYLEAILDHDINDDKKRNRNKMQMLLRSLARNESSLVSNQTILRDIEEAATGNDRIESEKTLDDYLDVLRRLYIIEDQPAYTENYRSRDRVGKTAKHHFTDPSLACAILGLSADQLLQDLNTFGLLFEALVERDLRVYMDALDGRVYHFRDNTIGLEVDAILEFDDGGYAAVEIKLGTDKITEAKTNLLKMASKMNRQPDFMCIIVGNINYIAQDPESGIYIVPAMGLGI